MKSNNDHPSFCDQLESAITVSCDDKYKPNHLLTTNPACAAPNLWGSIGIGGSPADLGIRSSATFHGNQWVSDRRFNITRNNRRNTAKQHIEYTSKSNNHNEIHTPQIIQAIIPSNTHQLNKKQKYNKIKHQNNSHQKTEIPNDETAPADTVTIINKHTVHKRNSP